MITITHLHVKYDLREPVSAYVVGRCNDARAMINQYVAVSELHFKQTPCVEIKINDVSAIASIKIDSRPTFYMANVATVSRFLQLLIDTIEHTYASTVTGLRYPQPCTNGMLAGVEDDT